MTFRKMAVLVVGMAMTVTQLACSKGTSPPNDRRVSERSGDAIVQLSTAPVGAVTAYAGHDSVLHEGSAVWMPCDGRSVAIADYTTLFERIGWTYGLGGDRVARRHFQLPDYRGYFLRGVDAGSRRDPDARTRVSAADSNEVIGDKVGSVQSYGTALPKRETFKTGDESNRHIHTGSSEARAQGGSNTFDEGDKRGVDGGQSITVNANTTGHTHLVESGGDAETRPRNMAVVWMIRVK